MLGLDSLEFPEQAEPLALDAGVRGSLAAMLGPALPGSPGAAWVRDPPGSPAVPWKMAALVYPGSVWVRDPLVSLAAAWEPGFPGSPAVPPEQGLQELPAAPQL